MRDRGGEACRKPEHVDLQTATRGSIPAPATSTRCVVLHRTFRNLRSSFATDVVQQFPAHVAGAWLGHSPTVNASHSWQARECNFDVAVTKGLDAHGARGARRGARAAHQGVTTGHKGEHAGKRQTVIPAEKAVSPNEATMPETGSVGPVRFELTTKGL